MKINYILVVALIAIAFAPGAEAGWFSSVFKAAATVVTHAVERVAKVLDITFHIPKGNNNCNLVQLDRTKNFLGFSGVKSYYECCDGYIRNDGDQSYDCDRAVCSGAASCGSRGSCSTPGVCKCVGGYTGTTSGCNTPTCTGSSDCGNRGSCSSPNTCTCNAGYTGTTEGCVHDVNECLSGSVCGQVCSNNVGSYSCSCYAGYRMVGGTCTNVNECAEQTDNCAHQCTDLAPGFSCSCDSGYTSSDDGVTCNDIDECYGTHECEGTCNNTPGGYYCTCDNGFTLIDNTRCEDKDECASGAATCEHFCTNNEGSYSCFCNPGFNLNADQRTCNDVDECANSPCSIHTCNNIDGSYSCACNSGYVQHGTQQCRDMNECEDKTDNCDHTCTNTEGGFDCTCNSGFNLDTNGHTCNDINECVGTNTCSAYAECINTQGSYTCQCMVGYAGDGVSCTPVCSMTCLNGGSCIEPETCSCPSRFEGNDCSTPICTSCVNGECMAGTTSNFCNCQVGYQGDGCEVDVNECENDHPCTHDCVNTEGSFHCACPDGFYLDDLQFGCIDHNECESDDHGCDYCVNIEGSYLCVCPDGFQLDEETNKICADIDECVVTQPCGQVCSNTEGSYECQCNEGYELHENGHDCVDIDECATETNNCDQLCFNNDGSFYCSCNDLFYLNDDQATCVAYIDEYTIKERGCPCDGNSNTDCACCVEGACICPEQSNHICAVCSQMETCYAGLNECELPSACHEYATCSDTEYSFECVCNEGFVGDGFDCQDIDECAMEIHACEQICINQVGSYTCACAEGYTTEGTSCIDVDECSDDNDCEQICINTDGSYECQCQDGYVINNDAKTCLDIDECAEDIDRCSQICSNEQGSYSCSCNEGFVADGMDCNDVDECSGEHACDQNCINIVGSYDCNCDGGFKLHADQRSCNDINECETGAHDCHHNCLNNVGSFNCSCEPGYYLSGDGRTCRENLNEWTVSREGCICYFDESRFDCPCCIDGGCQCEEGRESKCVQCGYGENCKPEFSEEVAPCLKRRSEPQDLGSKIVSMTTLKCDIRGRYQATQCDVANENCWCVNKIGEKIQGTDLRVSDGQPNCEYPYLVNGWTKTARGCVCEFDTTRSDCACCVKGGCPCNEANPHICTQCGLERNCRYLKELYSMELLEPVF